jgi:queuine/archaeosine tRNA-ribosyltransferase
LSFHNVYLVNVLMREARAAIEAGEWSTMRRAVAQDDTESARTT